MESNEIEVTPAFLLPSVEVKAVVLNEMANGKTDNSIKKLFLTFYCISFDNKFPREQQYNYLST